MTNLSYDAYFSVLIFWATFGGKMGVATTHAPNPDHAQLAIAGSPEGERTNLSRSSTGISLPYKRG